MAPKRLAAVSAVDAQLLRIERLAEKKAEELEAVNYTKYAPLFEVAIAYFAKKPVLMYGGSAINDLMPAKFKFYGDAVLPDLDVFVSEEKTEAVAQGLVNAFIKKGYTLAAYRPALHENTLKVFAEGVQIADISGVPKKAFAVLKKGSVVSSLGIPVANIQFLRWSLHALLSQPYDAHRWKKVYERIVNFYQKFPPPRCDVAAAISVAAPASGVGAADRIGGVTETRIHDTVARFVRESGAVMFGFDAIRLFEPKNFGKKAVAAKNQPMFNLLVSEEPRKVAYEIVRALRAEGGTDFSEPELFKVSSEYAADTFVPAHVFVFYKKRIVCGLYAADTCLSYVSHDGYKIASLQTMIRMYMSLMLSVYPHHAEQTPACVANALAWVHLGLVKSPSRKKMLEQFLLECYGDQAGLFTLRRQMLERAGPRGMLETISGESGVTGATGATGATGVTGAKKR